MSDIEARTQEAFKYIGGQNQAVDALVAISKQEESGKFPGRKPLVLLAGAAGSGKTSTTKATAKALGANLVTRDMEGFMNEETVLHQFLAGGYEEARGLSAATEQKSVYQIEGIDLMMSLAKQPAVVAEVVAISMNRWSQDFNGNVLVIATAYSKDNLYPSMLTRFTVIELNPLNKEGAVDVFNKGVARLGDSFDRNDLLGDMNGLDRLAARMIGLGWNTRDVNEFIRRSFALRSRFQPWEPMDTQFLESLMPPGPARAGFQVPIG